MRSAAPSARQHPGERQQKKHHRQRPLLGKRQDAVQPDTKHQQASKPPDACRETGLSTAHRPGLVGGGQHGGHVADDPVGIRLQPRGF